MIYAAKTSLFVDNSLLFHLRIKQSLREDESID